MEKINENIDINLILENIENTVVAEYIKEPRTSTSYQSEYELEDDFINRLTNQGYEYLPKLTTEKQLIENLRIQLQKLNNYTFTDNEWNSFFNTIIASKTDTIIEKTKKIQEEYQQALKRDDGTTRNIILIDKNHIHNNTLQVINQYKDNESRRKSRYDVTILVNGLPLVHIELKRRGTAIKEAFNQIGRYQNHNFSASSALYDYVQIFVISNGTNTKYYSNTTRKQSINENSNNKKTNRAKTSHSFEFTSFWADAKNTIINDIVDFTKTFFAKHTILNVLTKYCVFTSENTLLVMRPYQIIATEKIINKIKISSHYKQTGSIDAGGYIWHTTGSGKTLTSFKTAQLATKLTDVEKVLFVVDRKDLDYQTMKEYDRFEKGSANSNSSYLILKKQLENPDAKIIITTIQKLSNFVSKCKNHEIYNKHIVLIFDECHRSQFGEMHKFIVKSFKKYHIFGFTGTPIFAENATKNLFTTEQVFGKKLHTYTIVDAIKDNNVLSFRIEYHATIKKTKDNIIDKKVSSIDTEKVLLAPERIEQVTAYILEHFDQKTKRNESRATFEHKIVSNVQDVARQNHKKKEEIIKRQEVTGFNSIFAVASIPMAQLYYNEFKKQKSKKDLKIATIFSFSPNEDDNNVADENLTTEDLDKASRDFLDSAIEDYNQMFNTSYDTSSEKFQNYYKDLSYRMKNREIDLLIVVNMFLTGFDATTLNTLWVDKNLKMHGLMQAFSRTNRILNSVKTFGNIVCFRDLNDATNDAIALFGNNEAKGIIILKKFDEYYNGFTNDDGLPELGYKDIVDSITSKYPLSKEIIGEQAEKEFIKLMGQLLKVRNILSCFDDFSGKEILSEFDFSDYKSIYLDLHKKYSQNSQNDKANINDDVVFEIELIKQIDVTIDYILLLVSEYYEQNCKDKSILTTIEKHLSSSYDLRSKKDLINKFIEITKSSNNFDEDWSNFLLEQKNIDLAKIIDEENLNKDETEHYIANCFRDGGLRIIGTDLEKILPPVSRFANKHLEKKNIVIEKLALFFDKYLFLV